MTLKVSKYNLLPPENDGEDLLLSTLYDAVIRTVVINENLIGQISIGHNIFGLNKNKKTGNTYMDAREKSRYISILAHGAIMDVFNVSVMFHDKRGRELQELDVWNAILFVANWYETKGPRSCESQSARAKSLDIAGNVHELCAGPDFPLLVALYLSACAADGVTISVETYGGKTRKSVKYKPTSNKVSVADAVNIKDQLTDALFTNAAFLICRFSQFCELLSQNVLFCTKPNRENNLKWGIGCTVVTLCKTEKPVVDHPNQHSIVSDLTLDFASVCGVNNTDINVEVQRSPIILQHDNMFVEDQHCPEFDDSQSFCLHRNQFVKSVPDNYLASLKIRERCEEESLLDHDRYIYSPSYTVINSLPSSLWGYSKDPATWFMDSKGKLARSVIDCENTAVDKIVTSDDCETLEQTADCESNGIDTEENEHLSVCAEHRHSKETNNLHRFLGLSSQYSDYVSFPIFAGILPLRMQPSNHSRKGKRDGIAVPDTISKRIYRIQQYSTLARNARGECGSNKSLKSSVEMGHYELDIYTEKHKSIYNMVSLKSRTEKFTNFAYDNVKQLASHGNPARIEIAFESVCSQDHEQDLINGILDTLQICLNSTESYSARNCADIIKFTLDGTLSRLRTLHEMMATCKDDPKKYYELYHIRTEVAAKLYSFYSGRGTLKNNHLFSPKNSYMAGRPTNRMLMPRSNHCREKLLNNVEYGNIWNLFMNSLKDINGGSHGRLQVPLFELQFVTEIVNNNYTCGKACDKCFMVFANQQQINAFDEHSCNDVIKGKPIKVTDQKFIREHEKQLALLTDHQNYFINLVRNVDVFEGKNKSSIAPNIILTGGAGCGKSHTLKRSIADTLLRYGMDSFVVLASTKMAAQLVNGSTFHSFLGLKPDEEGKHTTFEEDQDMVGKHMKNMKDTTKVLRMQTTLKVIYIDEVGMLSNDHITFLNEILQFIKGNKNPFGGIQLILCGDVMQLPPILNDKEGVDRRSAENVFFFDSPAYSRGKFRCTYLVGSKRQSDPEFVRILNRLRVGTVDETDIHEMNEVWGGEADYGSAIDALKGIATLLRRERLGSMHEKGDKIFNKIQNLYCNKILDEHHKDIQEMEQKYGPFVFEDEESTAITALSRAALKRFERLIKTDRKAKNVDYNFVINVERVENQLISLRYDTSRRNGNDGLILKCCIAEDSKSDGSKNLTHAMREFLNFETKTESQLMVSVGMRVSFTSNTSGTFVSTNSLGIITEIKSDSNGAIEYILVAPCVPKGIVSNPVRVLPHSHRLIYKDVNKELTELTRLQFPIKAADCGNAFTTQGCSLDIPVLFNGTRLLKSGCNARVYVAASRVTDKKYFFTLLPLSISDVKVNKHALNFDRHLQETGVFMP